MNATSYAIDSHNQQTDTNNGNIYGMGSDSTGYFMAPKSLETFSQPGATSAAGSFNGTNWEDMSG